MKKALIITYYWPPSGGAGVQRWVKFIKYFYKYNINPYVITVEPNLASYPIIDKSLLKDIHSETKVYLTKTFEPYAYYKKINNKEIPFSGFANEGNPSLIQKTARFIRGNFFIPDARKGWNKFAYNKAIEIIKKEKIDTIITTSPPHSTQLIGLKLKKEFNIKWIADLRDPWTDIYYYKSMLHTKWAKNKDLKYEKEVLENSDRIIVVSNSIKNLFQEKSSKIIDSKINVISNGFDQDDFELSNSDLNDKFTISYTGTITKDYPIDSLKKALQKTKTQVNFIGKADETIRLELNSVCEFKDHVKHKESIKTLIESHLLLLIIPKKENNEGILTGKLFEYLGAKKPILCIGPINGDAAKIINECNAGKTFDYKDFTGIAEFILTCKKGDYKNEVNVNNYTRENLTRKLAEIIKEI